MDSEQRVQALEGEFKLLKSEIKQTLSSVRDFLLDIKLPTIVDPEAQATKETTATLDKSSPNPTPEEPMDQPQGGGDNGNGRGGGGNQNGRGGGDDFGGPQDAYSEPQPNNAPKIENNEPEINTTGGDQKEASSAREDDLSEIAAEDTGICAGEMPSDVKPQPEIKPQTEEKKAPEENVPVSAPVMSVPSSVPQVNMLANLIRWAAEARREIGMTQLPVFLDVYATSGYLTEDMKDNILHLAELATDAKDDEGGSGSCKVFNEQLSICMEIGSFNGEVPAEIRTRIRRLSELILQQNGYSNKADIWSQMLLKLHGILINGGGPVQPMNLVKKADKQEPVPEAAKIEETPATATGAELDGEDLDAALSQEDGLDEFTTEMDEEEQEEEMEEEEENSPSVKNCWPAKLRLILPVGDGAEQELDLGNLFIASDPKKQGNGHKKASTRKRK